MNTLSGYTELELGGELVPFKFGANAFALFCADRKIELYQIAETNIFGQYDNGVTVKAPDMFALADLFYYAHVTACRIGKKQPIIKELFIELLNETDGAYVKLQETLMESKIMGFSFLGGEDKQGNFHQSPGDK